MRVISTQGLGAGALKVLVYGESGSGKTSLIGSINEPTLIISAEAGLLSIAKKKIDVIDITMDDAGNVIAPELRIARVGAVLKWLQEPAQREKYRWIALDSLTEINQYLMAELKLKFPDRKDSLPMYGENKALMKAIIKAFRDLPFYNVLFTCLAEVDKDENAKRFQALSVVGSVSQEIPAMFDEVFYLRAVTDEQGQKKRQLVTGQGEPGITAKDRSTALDIYEDVSDLESGFAKVIAKIRLAIPASPDKKTAGDKK